MSAVNPLPSSATPGERTSYEPSMEEILASIRRIIADDQSLPGRALSREPEAEAPASVAPAVNTEPVAHAPSADIAPESRPVAPDEATYAHGQISAPQFPSPEPHVDARAAEPAAPEPTVIQAHEPEPPLAPSVEAATPYEPEPHLEPAYAEPDLYEYEEPAEPSLHLETVAPAPQATSAPEAAPLSRLRRIRP